MLLPRFVDRLLNQRQQGIGIVRLAEIVVAARGARAADDVGVLHSTDDDHWNVACLVVVYQFAAELEAIDVGQSQIEQDDAGASVRANSNACSPFSATEV